LAPSAPTGDDRTCASGNSYVPKVGRKHMVTRRAFLASMGAGLGMPLGTVIGAGSRRKKMAIVTTEWRFYSHAWHMGERFLVGYPIKGRWHHPDLEVVSAYIDQFPPKDLRPQRAREF